MRLLTVHYVRLVIVQISDFTQIRTRNQSVHSHVYHWTRLCVIYLFGVLCNSIAWSHSSFVLFLSLHRWACFFITFSCFLYLPFYLPSVCLSLSLCFASFNHHHHDHDHLHHHHHHHHYHHHHHVLCHTVLAIMFFQVPQLCIANIIVAFLVAVYSAELLNCMKILFLSSSALGSFYFDISDEDIPALLYSLCIQ